MKYVITKVYVVEAASAAEALQLLHLAADDRQDWLFQALPDTVTLKPAVPVKGWLTLLREHLCGRRTDDPRSLML